MLKRRPQGRHFRQRKACCCSADSQPTNPPLENIWLAAAGYGAEFQHESVAFSHALLAATSKLKVIAAILPGPWQPALAAKQLATIDQLTNGRIAVNIVSGWFKGEFHAIGEHWLEHDERYRRSEEFIRSLRGVWSQDNFTFRGDFYRFDNYSLKPWIWCWRGFCIFRKRSNISGGGCYRWCANWRPRKPPPSPETYAKPVGASLLAKASFQ